MYPNMNLGDSILVETSTFFLTQNITGESSSDDNEHLASFEES